MSVLVSADDSTHSSQGTAAMNTLFAIPLERIAPALPGLSAITIWETDTSRCVYRGP